MSYSPRVVEPAFLARPPRPAPSLAIVIPCFNEEAVLPTLLARLARIAERLEGQRAIAGRLRLVLVDDGSTDATWAMIAAAREHHNVTGLRLSRNHGHQRALLAGLMSADADAVISMDADLQDDPDAIFSMLEAYGRGAEIVFGVRASRGTDTAFKRGSAHAYYRLLSGLGVDLIPDHADFRLMSRKALRALAEFGESNLFLRGMVPQLGFATEVVTYDRGARAAGESKYPLRKMLALAIEGVTSFSVKPLRLITVLGFTVATMAFLAILYTVLSWLVGATVPGWASTVVPIYFLGGAHLVALGVIGEYVGKIYQETKRRPRFIVEDVSAPTAEATAAAMRLAAAE